MPGLEVARTEVEMRTETGTRPVRTLWTFGGWQVREDGLRAPYRNVEIPGTALTDWDGGSRVRSQLWYRFPDMPEAEDQDMLDALDRAVMWFGASPAVRETLCPSAGAPLVRRNRKPRQPREDKPRTKDVVLPRLRFLVLRRDGYRCQLCGKSAQDGTLLHVDHKIPRAKGGLSTIDNLWALCQPCNAGKGVLDLEIA